MSEIFAVEARRAYDEYFKLCVAHPDLTSYKGAKKNLSIPAAQDLWNSHDTAASRYTWFLAYGLKVFDDLLTHDTGIYWKNAIRFQLEMHRPALTAIWADHWSTIYSRELGEIVDNVIKGIK